MLRASSPCRKWRPADARPDRPRARAIMPAQRSLPRRVGFCVAVDHAALLGLRAHDGARQRRPARVDQTLDARSAPACPRRSKSTRLQARAARTRRRARHRRRRSNDARVRTRRSHSAAPVSSTSDHLMRLLPASISRYGASLTDAPARGAASVRRSRPCAGLRARRSATGRFRRHPMRCRASLPCPDPSARLRVRPTRARRASAGGTAGSLQLRNAAARRRAR